MLPISASQSTGSSQSTTRPIANPFIGDGPLPPGFADSRNRAFVRDVQRGELTSDQLNRLLASNSPYIQQAQRQGMRGAAARGLGNSSIAAGASQAAAIQAGLPIAQADAQANIQAAESNQRFLNEQLMASERNATTLSAAEISAGAATANAELSARNALQMQRERLAYEGEQAGVNRMFNESMAHLNHMFNLGMVDANLGSQLMQMAQGFQFDIGRMDRQFGQNVFMTEMQQDFNARMNLFNTATGLFSQNMGYVNGINLAILQRALDPDSMMPPEAVSAIFPIFNNQNQNSGFFPAFNGLMEQFQSLFAPLRRGGF